MLDPQVLQPTPGSSICGGVRAIAPVDQEGNQAIGDDGGGVGESPLEGNAVGSTATAGHDRPKWDAALASLVD